jgi:hypothetical protein
VSWLVPDAEVRKRGERTGLDTPVVLAVNDDHQVCGVSTPCVPALTHSVVRLGSTVARLKLKGIDGDPHKQRSVWFNSKQRVEPYQGWTCRCTTQRWVSLRGGGTGAAWLSSARAVRCWVKSRNERNPCRRLGYPRRLPRVTWRKVGMTSSQHGPYVLGDTHATMAGTAGCHPARGSQSLNPVSVRMAGCNSPA